MQLQNLINGLSLCKCGGFIYIKLLLTVYKNINLSLEIYKGCRKIYRDRNPPNAALTTFILLHDIDST